jgi:phosphomannomutase
MNDQLLATVQAWMAGDPDEQDKLELQRALDAGDDALLKARFAGRLSFGTAGLRGPIGAGPGAMNTAVIRQTCHGLADVLVASGGDPSRGVVVGFDARHRSQAFAAEACACLRARGIAVHLWDQATPTPSTPFWLKRLGALAAVQVTASHNPPQDNGFKVFWDHGAQIIPPVDVDIAAAIEGQAETPARDLASLDGGAEGPVLTRLGDEHLQIYEDAVSAETPAGSSNDTPYRIVYSAMHGVGGASIKRVLEGAGFELHVVTEQQQPDGNFPTVAFPNPEEDGAMDLAMALAAQVQADLVMANDPDADRLAVALPRDAGYFMLNGNETGLLLGDYCMRHCAEEDALFGASVVSSQALKALAEANGHRFSPALTGFKWIMAERRKNPERPFVFGFEEALGYCIGETVADKDGISAALAFAHMARALKKQGRSVDQALDGIYKRIGAFVSEQVVQRFEGLSAQVEMEAAVQRVRLHAPDELGGLRRQRFDDFSKGAPWDPKLSANLVALAYGDAREGLRVLVRPSGTEPKVKTYFEYHSAEGVDVAKRKLQAAMAQMTILMESL